MEYIVAIILIAIIYYVWQTKKSTDEKIKAILYRHTALFWALKNKKLIDMQDWKEGNKIARGEKTGPMSLKDFMDFDKE